MKTIIKDPLYFDCLIIWNDDKTTERVIIKLGNYVEGDKEDDKIFYYVESLTELNGLFDENNEEFYIDKIFSIDNSLD